MLPRSVAPIVVLVVLTMPQATGQDPSGRIRPYQAKPMARCGSVGSM